MTNIPDREVSYHHISAESIPDPEFRKRNFVLDLLRCSNSGRVHAQGRGGEKQTIERKDITINALDDPLIAPLCARQYPTEKIYVQQGILCYMTHKEGGVPLMFETNRWNQKRRYLPN